MLPRSARLRRSSDFGETVRRGSRAGRPHLVVHLSLPDLRPDGHDTPSRPGEPPRAGFVVSKAVGGSVVRHAVTRRLRHVVRAHLAELAPGSTTVVRALPESADADFHALEHDFAAALASVTRAAPRSPA